MRVRAAKQRRALEEAALRLVLVWSCASFLVFTVGPPLNHTSFLQSLCPPCDCHCSSFHHLFDPLGLFNQSFNDCGKHDPVMNEEMKKDIVTMLAEELTLQKIVLNETLEHKKKLVTNSRNAFSHYQKESEKCKMGVETCEKARERAEAELVKERKLSALWKKRAREYGWDDTTDLGLNVTQLV